jgi:hypothetical protein
MTLTDAQLKRIIQLLGMLGSNQDGEALNAARLAQRELGRAGVTWEELLRNGGNPGAKYTDDDMAAAIDYARSEGYRIGLETAKAKGIRPIAETRETFAECAQRLLDDYGERYLTDWEIGFMESWVARRWRPTDKQYAIFKRVADKCGTDCPEL